MNRKGVAEGHGLHLEPPRPQRPHEQEMSGELKHQRRHQQETPVDQGRRPTLGSPCGFELIRQDGDSGSAGDDEEHEEEVEKAFIADDAVPVDERGEVEFGKSETDADPNADRCVGRRRGGVDSIHAVIKQRKEGGAHQNAGEGIRVVEKEQHLGEMKQRRVDDEHQRGDRRMQMTPEDEERLYDDGGAGDGEEEEENDEGEDGDAKGAEMKGEAADATQERKLEEKRGVSEAKDANSRQGKFHGVSPIGA